MRRNYVLHNAYSVIRKIEICDYMENIISSRGIYRKSPFEMKYSISQNDGAQSARARKIFLIKLWKRHKLSQFVGKWLKYYTIFSKSNWNMYCIIINHSFHKSFYFSKFWAEKLYIRRNFFSDKIFRPLRVDPTIFDPHFLILIKFSKYENSSCQYWEVFTFINVKCSNWNVW